MAKTGGRTRRPLPPAVVDDLKRIGFVYREQLSEGKPQHIWQHKRFPSLELHVAQANTPGTQELIWQLVGSPTMSTSEEMMIHMLQQTIDFRTNPYGFMAKVGQHG